MGRKLVCICSLVEEREILSLLEKGAGSTREIQQLSGAGTTCGRCLPEIDEMVASWKKEKPKDPQNKLDFGL